MLKENENIYMLKSQSDCPILFQLMTTKIVKTKIHLLEHDPGIH